MKTAARLVSSALKLPVERISEATSMDNTPEWDSLAHVDLVVALESELGVAIDEETMLSLTSVSAVQQLIERTRDGA